VEALSEIDGLRVFGPPALRRSGVVSFDIEGIHPHDLATILDRHDVCIRAGHNCAMPLMHRLGVAATARASFFLCNTKEEIDRLVVGVHDAKRIFRWPQSTTSSIASTSSTTTRIPGTSGGSKVLRSPTRSTTRSAVTWSGWTSGSRTA